MRKSAVLGLLVLIAVLSTSGCGHSTGRASTPARQAAAADTALPVQPDLHVGAVFLGSTSTHACAAAVLHSKTGDLILTAAHCFAADPDATFVPGFTGDSWSARRWQVNAVYLDPRWLADHSPLADYAIARVSRAGGDSLEKVIGRGLALGSTPAPGSVVTVTAYPFGNGGPVGCRSATGLVGGGFPSLRCAGLVDGTSGAPWRSGSTVVGVIGGLHGGGCGDSVSYSSPFDGAVMKLLSRAEAGGPGDSSAQAYQDDCP
jgi:Trypsin